MSALREARPVEGRDIPADLDAALRLPDWREQAAWPVSLSEANDLGRAQMRRALAWMQGLDDASARDAALLALPTVLAYGREIVLAALAADRAGRAGGRITAMVPELIYLQTGEGAPPSRSGPTLPPQRARLKLMRRIARMRSWTGVTRLPRALLCPGATAVSHNPLLRAVAARDRRAVGFRHAEAILDAARRHQSSAPVMADHAAVLARTILGRTGVDGSYERRALALLAAMARSHLEKAAREMAVLRRVPLPGEIWTGSGGLYAPRAIGLEVLRRGGIVKRFDHGTPRGFLVTPEVTALLELSVSSEFVLATEGAAELCREEGGGALLARTPPVAISGSEGDPTFAEVPALRPGRKVQARPRVVYAPTQLLGFRQLLPAQPHDVIYLDWQLRVAEALRDLPVDLTCQPHPEGIFQNRRHPLESVAMTIRGNFAAQIGRADVFVFDYPATTALWEVVCTDARIVFLDLGSGAMTPTVARLFAERAMVIRVEHDEGNRPILDKSALRDAVLDVSAPVDPMPLRHLLASA